MITTPDDSNPFSVMSPAAPAVPIVVSIPHSGAAFPPDLRDSFLPEPLAHPDDTDWFVHQLYDFAPALGITVIHSRYCRYVIDLNRDPESKPLYADGRTMTDLVSAHDFLAQPLYKNAAPTLDEVKRRKQLYYWPYHDKLRTLLEEMKGIYGSVLLWEAHSIRRRVPTIRKEPFPDMILGDADGKSAHPDLSALALQMLRQHTGREVCHNDPFKGGYITRAFGQPLTGVHALQLEMAKDLYMDPEELRYSAARAASIREGLSLTLKALAMGMMALEPGPTASTGQV